jgi:hypothetical protein
MSDDLRTGVSPAVHAVLDRLDKGRVAWGTLSPEGLRAEIAIEAGALDGIDSGRDVEPGELLPFAAALASPAAHRLAALLLFGIERAATCNDDLQVAELVQ